MKIFNSQNTIFVWYTNTAYYITTYYITLPKPYPKPNPQRKPMAKFECEKTSLSIFNF